MIWARWLLKFFLILWASPYSFMGLTIGLIGLASGGRGRLRDGALEFYGGWTQWVVRHLPPGPYTQGMTLGHVIIGQTAAGLDDCAFHERIHVRQFERWGPLMGPAYLLCSAWLWIYGRDAYRDNPFEKQAYDAECRNGNN
ncbi:MAG: hypothetical protein IT423_01345 [Pirellulaceae bacterium]|nr:hypothetical protein [Pirellulaceae bacterium]